MYKVFVDDHRIMKDNKVLYHIQNMDICSDGEPYDVFVFLDHEPTKDDLRKLWLEVEGNDDEDGLDEFMTSSNWYSVWGEEL